MAIKRDRLGMITEMQEASIEFSPTIVMSDDKVIQEIYDAWMHQGKPSSATVYWEYQDGGRKMQILKISNKKGD